MLLARVRTYGLVVAAVTVWAAAADAAAQISPAELEAIRLSKRAVAVRILEPITVDGLLDETAWQLATPASEFYQQQPVEFEQAVHRTEVRFLYDDRTLYIGAMLFDDEPSRLVTNDLKREFGIRYSDGFGVLLDTFHDRQNSYAFITNPGGAVRDTMAWDNGRKVDANWNGVWTVRTRVLSNGWSVEYAIPFSTLRFTASADQEWGLNVVRVVRRDNEISTWAPVPRQFSHYRVGYAGTLTGITSVQSGRNLQVKPFATGRAGRGVVDTTAGNADGGLDVKWGFTSSLVLDGSYRTDFSQVEADEQQINLTRFSLFFPEKREFFLENQAAFQIGVEGGEFDDPRRDLVPLFSRRIGLSADGRPIPVVGGLRVTGRAGDQGVGVMTMQTEAFEGRPSENFTAMHVTHNVGGSGAIGASYFGREASGGNSFNRVAGVDFRLSPRRNVELDAFAMRSATAEKPGDWAGKAGVRVDAERHRARLGFVHVGDQFRHDLGFIQRTGVGTMFGTYAYQIRPAGANPTVREYSIGAATEATGTSVYDRLLTRIGSVRYGMTFADGAEINGALNTTFERLEVPFTIGNLKVPSADYEYQDGSVEYISDRSATVSGSVKIGAGEFWTGNQRTYSGGLRFRLNAHLAASTTLSRSDIRLPNGSLVADLAGFRVDWSFSPRMFLNAFVQYNGATNSWVSNVRYNFIHRPLSDIYVVWNETRLPGLQRRALLLKYTHMMAF